MPEIRVLSPHIANQIAAGEVVERPASIVKELVENALDAGAHTISVEIENGGIDLIRVQDDGCGISFADARTAFLRHATSKIQSAEDLNGIMTLGFRGEALPSIAAVADVVLKTKREGDETGTFLHIRSGEVLEHRVCAFAEGTSVETRELFQNVPARLKFLKSARTEAGYVSDYVSRMIMARPDVAFTLVNNGRMVYRSYGGFSLKEAIQCVYGSDIMPHLRELSLDDGYISVTGFVGTDAISRPNRTYQSFFLNGRHIRSAAISAALQRAFETRLMSGRFPFAVIVLRISGNEVDVNVHPTKMEVRFVDEQRVIRAVTAAAHRALLSDGGDTFIASPAAPAYSFGGLSFRAPQHSSTSQRTVPTGEETSFAATGNGFCQENERNNADYGKFIPLKNAEVELESQEPDTVAGTELRNGQQEKITLRESAVSLLPERERWHAIGRAFQGYWILQKGDELFFVDQHAAHERKLYEQLMSLDRAAVSQHLLCPMDFHLDPHEVELVHIYRKSLEEIGYGFTEAEEKINVTDVPLVFGEPLAESYLHEALEQLNQEGKTSSIELRRASLIQSACKHAVKATEALEAEEIERLLRDYESEGIPMTCPHGRPVMVALKKTELEKLFKRVL